MDTLSMRIVSTLMGITGLFTILLNQNCNYRRLSILSFFILLISLTVHKISIPILFFIVTLRNLMPFFEIKVFLSYRRFITIFFPIGMFMITFLLPEISFGYVVPESSDFYSLSILNRLILLNPF